MARTTGSDASSGSRQQSSKAARTGETKAARFQRSESSDRVTYYRQLPKDSQFVRSVQRRKAE